ncbi:MAG TPA: hypothetical protein VE338_05935 [Ktedonobacterales bacterium]|nr:hypothetical protein [Ktedonobacterales bacterium]
MAHREPLIDRIERMLFGATAQETVDMRLRLAEHLAERRLEQRILAVLEADDVDHVDHAKQHSDG